MSNDWSNVKRLLEKLNALARLKKGHKEISLKNPGAFDTEVELAKAFDLATKIAENPQAYFRDDGSIAVNYFEELKALWGKECLYPMYKNMYDTIALWHHANVSCPNGTNYMTKVLEDFDRDLDRLLEIEQANPIVRIFKQMAYNRSKYKVK